MAHFFADTPAPNILLVKSSSLGDVLHNLPAVSDIVRHFPNAQIDWVVEESFAALPKLHPAIRNVISVATRRWRRKLLRPTTWREIAIFRKTLATEPYNIAIDTQGLLKSALIMHGTHGLRCGFSLQSAREPLASYLYQQTFTIAIEQHAVERNRQLVAQALGYKLEGCANYGIRLPTITRPHWLTVGEYAVLLHSTSRIDKLWKEANWIQLGNYLNKKNIRCIFPWGDKTEQTRSLRLAGSIPNAIVPPRLNLNEAATLLGGAQSVIGVDTGLAHLAAALGVPTIGIYTTTNPRLTGLYAGQRATNLGNINHIPDVAAVIAALQQLAC